MGGICPASIALVMGNLRHDIALWYDGWNVGYSPGILSQFLSYRLRRWLPGSPGRCLLEALAERLEISVEERTTWFQELRNGALHFREISEGAAARQMLVIAVGMVAADGELDARRRHGLINLAKALDFGFRRTQGVYEATWGRRP
ncbi:MAG: hypothetical protein R3C68_13525 [Myxococcota bacterium]